MPKFWTGLKKQRQTDELFLIAGLGNPGLEYENTRHNIGRQIVGVIARICDIHLEDSRFHAISNRAKFESRDIILLCPATYMNLSGNSIKECSDFFGLTPEKILVIHDDLDLPFGKIKIVRGGGPGGHKGVTSIIESLDSNLFPRIKVGIGRPSFDESIEEFVLSPFYKDQKEFLDNVIHAVIGACRLYLSSGVEASMNHFNNMNLPEISC